MAILHRAPPICQDVYIPFFLPSFIQQIPIDFLLWAKQYAMFGAGDTLLSNMDKAPTHGELTDFISNPL